MKSIWRLDLSNITRRYWAYSLLTLIAIIAFDFLR